MRTVTSGAHLGVLIKFAKFALVGFSGVLVNTGVLFLFYQVAHLSLVVASALAVEIAIVNNFLWNDRWTFGESNTSLLRFARFNLVSLGGLIITTGILYLLVTFWGLNYLIANLMAITVAMAWNFGLSLYWTWG